MATVARELRHAWRSLLHRKAYFVACAGTLVLVLGANAAMFAVVNATMLRPLPFVTEAPVVQLYGQPRRRRFLRRDPLQQWKCRAFASAARTLAPARRVLPVRAGGRSWPENQHSHRSATIDARLVVDDGEAESRKGVRSRP